MTTPPGQAVASPDGRAGIDAALVRRLIASQFPDWSELPIEPVEVEGWDNRTYRLGDDSTVRLPTAAGYSPAVEKEDRWLPVLAPLLPVAVPEPVATGVPQHGYPFGWSVRRWIDGATAHPDRIEDMAAFATSVAEFRSRCVEWTRPAVRPRARTVSIAVVLRSTITPRPGARWSRFAG